MGMEAITLTEHISNSCTDKTKEPFNLLFITFPGFQSSELLGHRQTTETAGDHTYRLLVKVTDKDYE